MILWLRRLLIIFSIMKPAVPFPSKAENISINIWQFLMPRKREQCFLNQIVKMIIKDKSVKHNFDVIYSYSRRYSLPQDDQG